MANPFGDTFAVNAGKATICTFDNVYTEPGADCTYLQFCATVELYLALYWDPAHLPQAVITHTPKQAPTDGGVFYGGGGTGNVPGWVHMAPGEVRTWDLTQSPRSMPILGFQCFAVGAPTAPAGCADVETAHFVGH